MQSIFQHLIEFVIIFPAIVLHEISHGYVANRLGDPTAKRAGRLTLNPLAHIDPIGTVVLPITMLVLSGGSYFFGWASRCRSTREIFGMSGLGCCSRESQVRR